MYQGTYCISLFLLDGIGWLERHWRPFLLYITLPSTFALLSFLTLLESPRWLLATGQTKQADKVLRRVASRNGTKFTARLLSPTDNDYRILGTDNEYRPLHTDERRRITKTKNTDESRSGHYPTSSGSSSEDDRIPAPEYRSGRGEVDAATRESRRHENKYGYADLFGSRKVAMLTVSQSFIWLTTAMLYFAITLESSKLGGNMYKVFAFSVVVEIPGSFAALFLCNRVGRKRCILGSLLLCGFFVGGIALVPRSLTALSIVLALVAKFFVNLTFNAVYIWTFEINPTVIRSQGLNFCATLGYAGGIFSPYLVGTLQNVDRALPFVTMSLVAVCACACGLLLPETNGLPTRETYGDYFNDAGGGGGGVGGCDVETCDVLLCEGGMVSVEEMMK